MYVIPVVALFLVIVVASVWSPVFALIVAVPLFLLFLGYVGLSRRSAHRTASGDARPSGEPASGEGESGGIWGERRV